jgi:hypothetical protein
VPTMLLPEPAQLSPELRFFHNIFQYMSLHLCINAHTTHFQSLTLVLPSKTMAV